ncbi:MAG: NAD(P)-binding protein [Planctomycetota bacterium]|nr:NAD(P)-binding protein [Planctomycetota bacterium]
MRYVLPNVKLPFDVSPAELNTEIARMLAIAHADVNELKVLKRSVDSRNTRAVKFVYKVAFSSPLDLKKLEPFSQPRNPLETAETGTEKLPERPVVVGTGPAGLFAAVVLAEKGYKPLVLEMGPEMSERHAAAERTLAGDGFGEFPAFLYGEGGAGTYSDGKLTGRSAGEFGSFVLDFFARHGAPSEIRTEAWPHIGSDRLRSVLPRIRKHLTSLGATFSFNSRVCAMKSRPEGWELTVDGDTLMASAVIFACGQSSFESYQLLREAGIALETKPYQMGVRIEFPQLVAERWAYGKLALDHRLPRARFNMAFNDKIRGTSVHTFCNCPGGEVLPVPERPQTLCVNGMSNLNRNSQFSNTALVTTLYGVDTGNDDPMSLLEHRLKVESEAYRAGGGELRAPAIAATDFARGDAPSKLPDSSYKLGLEPADISELLPVHYVNTLRDALKYFDSRMKGVLGSESVLIAVESRSSSPVRVPREQTLEAKGTRGLYVVGEGSGYAGGIMSSAIDGLRAALHVAGRFAPRAEMS